MNGNGTVVATYKKEAHVALTLNPSIYGRITASPAPGTDGKYGYGTIVALRAKPYAGYRFKSWGFNAAGTENPIRITLNGRKKVKAIYARR